MFEDWPSFEELMKIANEHPERLEAFRQRKVDEVINSAPDNMKRRLRGLQFQIDCQRQLQKTPMASCLTICSMMCDSLHKLNEALNGTHNTQSELISKSAVGSDTGGNTNIVNFPVNGYI